MAGVDPPWRLDPHSRIVGVGWGRTGVYFVCYFSFRYDGGGDNLGTITLTDFTEGGAGDMDVVANTDVTAADNWGGAGPVSNAFSDMAESRGWVGEGSNRAAWTGQVIGGEAGDEGPLVDSFLVLNLTRIKRLSPSLGSIAFTIDTQMTPNSFATVNFGGQILKGPLSVEPPGGRARQGIGVVMPEDNAINVGDFASGLPAGDDPGAGGGFSANFGLGSPSETLNRVTITFPEGDADLFGSTATIVEL